MSPFGDSLNEFFEHCFLHKDMESLGVDPTAPTPTFKVSGTPTPPSTILTLTTSRRPIMKPYTR